MKTLLQAGLTFLVFLLVGHTVGAQFDAGMQALESGQYVQAQVLFEALYKKKKTKVEGAFGLASLHLAEGYEGYGLAPAYGYATEAGKAIRELDQKERNELKALGLGYKDVSQLRDSIREMALTQALETNTLEAYSELLDNFRIPREQRDTLLSPRFNQLLLQEVAQATEYERVKELMDKHGRSLKRDSPTLYQAADSLLFGRFLAREGWSKFDRFKSENPGSAFARDLSARAYARIADKGELKDFEGFLKDFPDSRIAPLAEARKVELFREKLSGEVLEAPMSSSGFGKIREIIKEPLDERDWDGALAYLKPFRKKYGAYEPFQGLVAILEAPVQGILIRPLPGDANSSGREYVPLLSADGLSIYFCGKGRKDNLGMEDIFVTHRQDSLWQEAQLVASLCTSHDNEAPLAISADGNRLILFLGGKIAYSDRTADGWTASKYFPDEINGHAWQADAQVTADGQAMIFVTGGIFGDGRDIKVSLKQEDGSWGPAFSIGSTINTPGTERQAFLHPDMKTLYFSSDGHPGLGSLDVFRSTRLDSSWTNWSKPVNLGKEINTTGNDWGYKISTDGSFAIFSATNADDTDSDIFEVNLPPALRPDPVNIISGEIEGLKPGTSARIIAYDEAGNKLGEYQSDPGTGKYFIVLPLGVKPIISVEQKGVLSTPIRVDIPVSDGPANLTEKISVVDFNQVEGEGVNYVFDDVLFETGQYAIRPAFLKRLDDLAEILASQGLSAAIQGHTDNVGTPQSNLALSANRANAVRDYLISRGCNPAQITAQGFGQTQPVVDNDSDSNRAKNRRVELKISKSN